MSFFRRVLPPFLLALAIYGLPPVRADETEAEWKLVNKDGELAIYNRARPGSEIVELKAQGSIDSEPLVVKRVLDDAEEYPRFMPYVAESRIIARKPDFLIGYQRIAPPMVSDRDFTVRVRFETKKTPAGPAYYRKWQLANDLGPAEKRGVTRVKINEGSWLLEPGGEGKTRATYMVYSDSGGSLPPMLVNAANKTAIPKLFEAVRKQSKLEKYRSGGE